MWRTEEVQHDQLSERAVGQLGDFTLLLFLLSMLHLLVLCFWSRRLAAARFWAGLLSEVNSSNYGPPGGRNCRDKSQLTRSLFKKLSLFAVCGRTGFEDDDDDDEEEEAAADGGAAATCGGCSSMPDILYWPNAEVLLVIFFAAGVANSCASTLASTATGFLQAPDTLTFAVFCMLFLAGFLVHEGARITVFWLRHHSLWVGEETVESRAKMDDPLLIVLHIAHIQRRPLLRFRGHFAVEKPGAGDKYRYTSATERADPWLPAGASRLIRALHAPLARWWRRGEDDMYASLSLSWMFGVNGRTAPTALYQHTRVLFQALIGILVGVLESCQGARTGTWHTALVLAMAAHVLLAAYSLGAAPSADRVEGIFMGVELCLSFVSLLLRYVYAVGGASSAWLGHSAFVLLAALSVALFQVPYELIAWAFFRLCMPKRKKGRERSVRSLPVPGATTARVAPLDNPLRPDNPLRRSPSPARDTDRSGGPQLWRAPQTQGSPLAASAAKAQASRDGVTLTAATLRARRAKELQQERKREFHEAIARREQERIAQERRERRRKARALASSNEMPRLSASGGQALCTPPNRAAPQRRASATSSSTG